MKLFLEDMVNYWYLWILAVLFFGVISFAFGFCAVQEDKKSTAKCLRSVFCVELVIAIAAYVMLGINSWIKIGASFWWIIYEHGPEVYIAVIALVFIPLGYLAGMVFARKRA